MSLRISLAIAALTLAPALARAELARRHDLQSVAIALDDAERDISRLRARAHALPKRAPAQVAANESTAALRRELFRVRRRLERSRTAFARESAATDARLNVIAKELASNPKLIDRKNDSIRRVIFAQEIVAASSERLEQLKLEARFRALTSGVDGVSATLGASAQKEQK